MLWKLATQPGLVRDAEGMKRFIDLLVDLSSRIESVAERHRASKSGGQPQ